MEQSLDNPLCYAQISVHADYTSKRIGTPQIDISFVDEDSGQEYNAAVTNVEHADWPLPKVGSEERKGTITFSLRISTSSRHKVGWHLSQITYTSIPYWPLQLSS